MWPPNVIIKLCGEECGMHISCHYVHICKSHFLLSTFFLFQLNTPPVKRIKPTLWVLQYPHSAMASVWNGKQ